MSYYKNPVWSKLELIMGIVLVALGLAVMFMTNRGGGLQIGLGAMFIVFHFAFGTKPVVTLHDDYFDMKAAPLAARQLVRYSDITSLDTPRPKKASVITRSGKTIGLPLGILTVNDRESLVSEIRKRIS